MIDIFAKWKDGDLVCVPKKRRGMSKGEYLRALHICQQFNKIKLKKGADNKSTPNRSEDDQLWLEFMNTNANTRQ